MYKLFGSIWMRLALIVAGGAIGAQLASLTAQRSAYEYNVAQVNELARQTLASAETAVDYAVITLSDIVANGRTGCDFAALTMIRETVYRRGTVKDIQIHGARGEIRCAAQPQASQFGLATFDPKRGVTGSNTSITLYPEAEPGSGLVSVEWRFGPTLGVVAVLNIDSLMFGMFPPDLREHAAASLTLGAGHSIGMQAPDRGVSGLDEPISFTAVSERYPLNLAITVEHAALAKWHGSGWQIMSLLGAALGVALSAWLGGWLARPPDPVAEMRRAIGRGEFVPFVQPVFEIDTKRVTGCEVLARWRKPDGTLVGPLDFIGLAESSGLIVPMTRMLMRTALEELSEVLANDRNFRVSFNVVPDDLTSETFSDELNAIVAEAKVARRQIVIEVTERQELADMPRAAAAIAHLRDLGYGVALDDTGTGHNGLANVQNLGASTIKIDKHFVDLIESDRAARTIVRMLVQIAGDLSMRTIAEGIETEEQRAALARCGVLAGQGYLVAKPMPAGEFIASRQAVPTDVERAAA